MSIDYTDPIFQSTTKKYPADECAPKPVQPTYVTHKQLHNLAQAVAMLTAEHVKENVDPLKKEIAELKARLEEIEKRGWEYCGAYQKALEYRRGSVVTYAGAEWTAVTDTQPGDVPQGSRHWQLSKKSHHNNPVMA
jgi:hypothetical protein